MAGVDALEFAREAVADRAKAPKTETAVEAVESLMNMEMRSSSFDLDTVVTMVLNTEVAKWFAAVLREEEDRDGDFVEAVRTVEAAATREVM